MFDFGLDNAHGGFGLNAAGGSSLSGNTARGFNAAVHAAVGVSSQFFDSLTNIRVVPHHPEEVPRSRLGTPAMTVRCVRVA